MSESWAFIYRFTVMLYIWFFHTDLVLGTGIEPVTSSSSAKRYYQLSYPSIFIRTILKTLQQLNHALGRSGIIGGAAEFAH